MFLHGWVVLENQPVFGIMFLKGIKKSSDDSRGHSLLYITSELMQVPNVSQVLLFFLPRMDLILLSHMISLPSFLSKTS